MKKLVNAIGGEIFAIPLFLSDISDLVSFKKDEFNNKGKEFVFCRVIEDKMGGGFFIEVFDLVGNINEDLETIIHSKRLFRPVAFSGLGIYKKRWKKLYTQENYDKEKDSQYSQIQLVLGSSNDLRLWQNGKESQINEITAKKYEKWQIWSASQLERRIIEELGYKNKL